MPLMCSPCAEQLLLPWFGGSRSVQGLRLPAPSQRAVKGAQVSFWYQSHLPTYSFLL